MAAEPGPPAVVANALLGPESRFAFWDRKRREPTNNELSSMLLFARGLGNDALRPAIQTALDQATRIEIDNRPEGAIVLKGNDSAAELMRELDILIRLLRRLLTHFDLPDPRTVTDVGDTQYTWLTDALRDNFGSAWIDESSRQVVVERIIELAKFWAKARWRALTEYRRNKGVLLTAPRYRDYHEDRKFQDILFWLHQANPIGDSYLAEISKHIFQREPGDSTFDVSMKALFWDVYGIPWPVFRDIRNFIDDPDNPNLSQIFRWLVAYVVRYHRWREDRMGAVKELTPPNSPTNHLRRRMTRAFIKVDTAFRMFGAVLRELVWQRKHMGGVAQSTYARLRYVITGLTALVRASRINRLPLHHRTKFEYGDAVTFPNFGTYVSPYKLEFLDKMFDATMTNEPPDLHDLSRVPNDQDAPEPRGNEPGAEGRLGGPMGEGGPGGLMGPGGPGGPGGPPLPDNWYNYDVAHSSDSGEDDEGPGSPGGGGPGGGGPGGGGPGGGPGGPGGGPGGGGRGGRGGRGGGGPGGGGPGAGARGGRGRGGGGPGAGGRGGRGGRGGPGGGPWGNNRAGRNNGNRNNRNNHDNRVRKVTVVRKGGSIYQITRLDPYDAADDAFIKRALQQQDEEDEDLANRMLGLEFDDIPDMGHGPDEDDDSPDNTDWSSFDSPERRKAQNHGFAAQLRFGWYGAMRERLTMGSSDSGEFDGALVSNDSSSDSEGRGKRRWPAAPEWSPNRRRSKPYQSKVRMNDALDIEEDLFVASQSAPNAPRNPWWWKFLEAMRPAGGALEEAHLQLT